MAESSYDDIYNQAKALKILLKAELEKQNEELRVKLDQKQLHIDKTNMYWKKKMHHLKVSEAL